MGELLTSLNELQVFRTLYTIICDSDNQIKGIKIRVLFYSLQMKAF